MFNLKKKKKKIYIFFILKKMSTSVGSPPPPNSSSPQNSPASPNSSSPQNYPAPPNSATLPDSLNNALLADFAKSAVCFQQSCVLSHKLVDIDKKNFGKQYANANGRNTAIFPRICSNCFAMKFGLFESFHTESFNFLNCIINKTQGLEMKDRLEGPYLRAFKSENKIIENIDLVFPKNCIIIPSGELLVDILMSDSDHLFNKSKSVPTIQLSCDNIEKDPPTTDAGKTGTGTANVDLIALFNKINSMNTNNNTTSSNLDTSIASSNLNTSTDSSILNTSTDSSILSTNDSVAVQEVQTVQRATVKTLSDIINTPVRKPETFTINPYIYSYFKHLYDWMTSSSSYTKSNSKLTHFENILCNQDNLSINCLDATYEVDLLLISNLINPIAALSRYISEGRNIILNEAKSASVIHIDLQTEPPLRAELATLERNLYAAVVFSNDEFEEDISTTDIQCLNTEKLQHFNAIMFNQIIGMRQYMVNRQMNLITDYPNDKGVYSAGGAHVSSFCVPSIIKNNEDIYRQHDPNVKWIEGVGLISTKDICKNDLLIIDHTVQLKNFTRVKMNNYEQSLQYVIPKMDESMLDGNGNLCYDYEARKLRVPKMCLYT
jgi:hypothetical protein